jgi:flagellar biosynthesis/type III secretory pathway protein FliH
VLKVNNFDDVAKDTLDEWIYFLKNSEVKEDFRAKGLKEAREKLDEASLSAEERAAYKRYQENQRLERSVLETALQEGEEKGLEKGKKEGLEKGKKEGLAEGMMQKEIEFVLNLHQEGFDPETIAKLTSLPVERVREILGTPPT